MLKSLSIRDVVLIQSLDLEIGAGFTAMTGETGAGKSILLDALGLAMGSRAERGAVRNGAERALVSAEFLVPANHSVLAILDELGFADGADGDSDGAFPVILRRQIGVDGRSRAFINDAPCSITALRQVAGSLIEIHGQHAALGLLDQRAHLPMLDDFASLSAQVAGVRQAFFDFSAAKTAYDDAVALLARAGEEKEYLGHVVAELSALGLSAGEEERLDLERRALMGTEKLADALLEAKKNLESGGMEQRLTSAAVALSRAGDLSAFPYIAPLLASANQAIDSALTGLAQAQTDVERAGYSLEADPKKLDGVEERLFTLRAAARKHGVTVDGLMDVLAKAKDRLALIDAGEEGVLAAKNVLLEAEAEYLTKAQTLSGKRRAVSVDFVAAIMNELPALKLEKCRFRVNQTSDGVKHGPTGVDNISFEIAPNPGAGFGPLAQIASGGELSRLSLALKVVLSGHNNSQTMVFDEVDAGIGGATADAVGRRLARLGQHNQVLVVTHAPQVAARANQHWRIEKTLGDDDTRTHVRDLTQDERVGELARMLAGDVITSAAEDAAKALLAS